MAEQFKQDIVMDGKTFTVEGSIALNDFKITLKDGNPQPDPDPTTKPEMGTILHGGWGGNTDANTWKVVNMKNPADQFKIVDDKGVNIMTNLKTKEAGDALIAYFKKNKFPPNGDNPPPTPPTDPIPTEGEAPYKGAGPKLEMTQRGPTKRNYASGKPSDWTIEKNCKGIKFDDIMAVFEITVTEMAHDDNLSIKLGGVHMSTGWFDNGISIYEGETALGYEPDHPETHLGIIKGPSLGDIRGKRVRIASTYFKKTNKTEFWCVKDGKWMKCCEGVDVGGFKPKNEGETEVQLRIDGFKFEDKPPIIHDFFVQEIA